MDPCLTLQKFGISPSPQRAAIYGFLKEHPVHPTAEMIFRELRPSFPTMSLTTVYNTLKLLSEKRAVQKVIIEDGELRFDADMRDHAHFKCTHCGRILDLFPAEGEVLLERLPSLPAGARIQCVHICIHGLCPDCAAVKE